MRRVVEAEWFSGIIFALGKFFLEVNNAKGPDFSNTTEDMVRFPARPTFCHSEAVPQQRPWDISYLLLHGFCGCCKNDTTDLLKSTLKTSNLNL